MLLILPNFVLNLSLNFNPIYLNNPIMSNKIFDVVKPGVVTGEDVQKVFAIAKQNEYAIPAVNVVGSNSVNAVIEAAKLVNSPVIVQFSNGGAVFFAGKGLSNENLNYQPCIPLNILTNLPGMYLRKWAAALKMLKWPPMYLSLPN